ncbi:MAG: dethiobiotin synthase [Rikenellaceae bacterium]|jgi:dethiobiotin synthetase|nr:dethiobiotin synthase [Rikenellaceae bacterium]
MKRRYFITAIDTDAGKSLATGLAARWLLGEGVSVITQKMAQTGCTRTSEDIETHRRLMGIPLQEADLEGTTCPYIFPFPASPRLAAELAGRQIDFFRIFEATERLEETYECVLVEGVGGLMVPLVDDQTVADYLVCHPHPTVIVVHARLGSINHALLTLKACSVRGIEVVGVIYNTGIATDPLITDDTRAVLQQMLGRNFPEAAFLELPRWHEGDPLPDFSALFRV